MEYGLICVVILVDNGYQVFGCVLWIGDWVQIVFIIQCISIGLENLSDVFIGEVCLYIDGVVFFKGNSGFSWLNNGNSGIRLVYKGVGFKYVVVIVFYKQVVIVGQ